MIELITKDFPSDIKLPFFAKEKYLKSKSNYYGWIINDKFILPYIIYKKMIFKRLIFTTEVIQRGSFSIIEEKQFLNETISFIKKEKLCDFIHKPQPSAVFRTYPDNCDSFRWGSYKINIKTNLNDMIKSVYKSQRNYINRAIRDGVFVEKTNNINKIHTFCNDTLKRQNIQLLIDLKELKNQQNLFKEDMLLFEVKYKNDVQGTLVIFKDNHTAYAEYAGSIKKPKHGSIKLMHLTAMEYLAKEYNIKTYDFIGAIPDIIPGSREAGIQRFKKEFGSTLIEGYQFSLIINPFKYFLFDICLYISFWKRGIKYEDPIIKFKKLSESKLKI